MDKIRELENLDEVKKIGAEDLYKQLYEYGEIKNYEDLLSLNNFHKRIILLTDIDEDAGEGVAELIRYYNQIDSDLGIAPEDRQPVKIYIDSNGGSVFSAFVIIDAITLSKTPVYTINMGVALSAGFEIFIAGHKRYAYPNAVFLFHEGSTSSHLMDAGKFRNFANFYDLLIERAKNLILNKTNIDIETYKEKRNDDWWFFAEEAIELGVCDEILTDFI